MVRPDGASSLRINRAIQIKFDRNTLMANLYIPELVGNRKVVGLFVDIRAIITSTRRLRFNSTYES